jgi:hypothetical protein
MRACLTPRSLTPEELELLNRLIEHGLPEAKSFAPQMEKIRATRACDCGCPSILLHVEEGVPPGKSSSNIISDAFGKTQQGNGVGVILFQKEGKLTELEVYSLDTVEGNWGLPVLDSLQTYEWADPSTLTGSKE